MDVDPRWYESFFGADWLALALREGTGGDTRLQVDFVVDALGLEPGARILDCPCGHGRHSLELARRGYRVTGVDLNDAPLAQAARDAAAAGIELELLQADMRELPFAPVYDAVLNLFSGFGYFESEEENARALAAFARVLAPGGSLLLETVNPTMLLRKFRERSWDTLEDGTELLEERAYDHATGRTTALWRFVRPDGSRGELRHSMRLYTAAELGRLLGAAGLEVRRLWGDFEGNELGLDSPRLIVRADKPAQS